jgi:hypothetical protein
VNAAIPLRDPLVRDLYWALSSAPLLRRTDAALHWPAPDWFGDITQTYLPELAKLDDNPQPLRAAIEMQKDRRLGNYFETLWHFWLETNDRYRILYANLPVRGADRTLGEFDLLVRDRQTGKTLHWELAVKFYLGVGDTMRLENWWGPAQHDRLDIKTRRLLNHQSKLSQYPQAAALLQELSIRIDEAWVILKGRLFYPLHRTAIPPPDAEPSHLRGFWAPSAVFAGFQEALWLPLHRRQWLAPRANIDDSACMRTTDLLAQWRAQPLRGPVCVARVINGVEIERGFVVPDDWGPANL